MRTLLILISVTMTTKNWDQSEIVFFTPDGVETVSPAKNEMKICSFLWVYYGYPTSSYEGINVRTDAL